MPEITSEPQRRYRNQAYGRAIRICNSLASMRNGGTTSDVQAVMIESGERYDRGTIESALFFLVDIGRAKLDETDGRWWTARP